MLVFIQLSGAMICYSTYIIQVDAIIMRSEELVACVINGDDTLVKVGNGGEGLFGEVNLVANTSRAKFYNAHSDGVAVFASSTIARNLAFPTTRGTPFKEAPICSDYKISRQEFASVVAITRRRYI